MLRPLCGWRLEGTSVTLSFLDIPYTWRKRMVNAVICSTNFQRG